MSTTYYEYRYYIDGRQIAILQRLTDTAENPRILIDGEYFGVPQTADSSAIYLYYTVKVGEPLVETDTLSLNDTLSMAVLHYVKARVAEESTRDMRAYQFHMNEFHRLIQKESENRRGHSRTVSPNYLGAIR